MNLENECYYLEHQEEPIPQDEQVLFDGISDDAAKKKGMERVKPFRVYIKNASQSVLGGASGVTYYGCLRSTQALKDGYF